MKTPFDEEFFDDAGKEEAPDKIFQALKEQHHTHESIEFDDRFFEIVTTLEQKTRSWAYTSSIRLDGQQLEELNLPPHRGSERTTDSEEEVPAALIHRAAEAHLLQCANVRHLIETEGRKKLSPFRVNVLINGVNVISVPFEVIKTDSGSSFLEGTKITAQNLYQEKDSMHFGVLELTSGKVDLTINARDITGNKVEKRFSFIVK